MSVTHVTAVAGRSARRTLRQPAMVIPPIAFPLVLFGVLAAGLAPAAGLAGFPGESYTPFALAVAFLSGAMLCLTNGGIEVAHDLETGFLQRLSLTAVRRPVLVMGYLCGPLVLGLLQAAAFYAAGLAAGSGVATGLAGAVVLLALFEICVLGFAALGAVLALRTGSGEAVQNLAPLALVLLFLSSWTLPRDLIETDWFRAVATVNPVSYVIEAMRGLLVIGWDASAIALGFATAVPFAALSIIAVVRSLRKVVRT
jgi:ABC-2 type transport system permease protein